MENNQKITNEENIKMKKHFAILLSLIVLLMQGIVLHAQTEPKQMLNDDSGPARILKPILDPIDDPVPLDPPDLYLDPVGSIAGTFDVSATGGATYSIPIEVPPGVGEMQPTLAIVYNSQSGNGMIGWGCNLSGLSVITKAPKDIYHDGTAKALTNLADEAYYLDGQRLIYSSGTAGQEGAIYYPESDPFTKITVHGTYNATTAITWFEVQATDGMKYYYGSDASGRLSYTSGSSPRIFAWYINYVEDPMRNYMTYTYNNWNYSIYPNTITYGDNNIKNAATGFQNTVTFTYETRSDASSFVIEGNKGSMSYRLKTITCKTGSNTYRTYDLKYNTTSDGSYTKFSRLTTVTENNGASEALKPTKLNWVFLPSTSQSVAQPTVNAASTYPALAFTDQQYCAADLNGDGLTDIVGIAPVKIPNGTGGYNLDNYAYIYWASLDANGNVKYTNGSNYTLGPSFKMGDWSEKKDSPCVLDFNGDGINDLLVPNVSIINELNYKVVKFVFVGGILNNQSINYKLLYSSEMPVYSTADFNNDGKGDIVFIEKGQNSGKYPCGIRGLNSGTTLYLGDFNLTLPSKPEKIFTSDFNGDGLCDILVFYNGGYTIFWNQGNGISNTTFSDSKKTSGSNIGNVWRIWSGDFNGDGLMDFLMSASMDNKWYFALNNGNGTFTKQLAYTLDIYDQNFTDKDDNKFDCFVYDIDGDGKSDVVITKAMYTKKSDISGSWGEFNKTYTYWFRSTGSALTQIASATSVKESDAISSRYLLGDFNGDGKIDLMNYGYNCYSSTNANSNPQWLLYSNSTNDNTGNVISITNGYGSTTTITYASLVNGGIYTKGTGSAYPVADYTIPFSVVKSFTANNGAAGTVTTNYQYGGLKAHLQGKGLLGLSFVKANNTTLGVTTESGVKTWNNSFYIPSATYTKTTVDGKTAETNVTMIVTDKGSKKYFAYPSTQTDKDLDGNTITTTRQFDTSYGYLKEEKADFGNSMYKTVQYSNYILFGNAYKPQLITQIQKHTDDAATFTQKTSITYNQSKEGYQKQVVENYGSSLPLTTDYTYDYYGNIETSKTSGSGISPVITNYEYDATKRFIVKSYTSPASVVNTFKYDTWGNVLTEKDETNASNILTTTHTYDKWDIRQSTTMPDGTKTTYQNGWDNNTPAKSYFTMIQGTGQPWVKTWYDNQGREVAVESIGAKNMKIQQTTAYNTKGHVQQKENKTGNITTTEKYTYDGRGRVSTYTHSAGQSISYSYGNRSVTTVTNGRSYTKTCDAWGGIKSSTDPLQSVNYVYYSLGKPKTITTGGAVFTMDYNNTGTQKTLTDPNAGTVKYEYNSAGQLTKQTDGNGKVTVNVYDALGRIDTVKIDGVVTKYTYGTAGYELRKLTKIQTGNNYISYTHDKLGRVQNETRQIDGSGSLSFAYTYNLIGQLDTVTYPGGLKIKREYDTYGNLQKMSANSQVVWTLTGATGTTVTEQLGAGIFSSVETRSSQGLLTNSKISKISGGSTLYSIDYVFNGATGNLTSRTPLSQSVESFQYDNLDRLTSVKKGTSTTMSTTYLSNGNIDTKTGLGKFSYTNTPHAVTSVENTGSLISSANQSVTYNAFNKVSGISEKVGADNYVLDFVYGPEQQRWKTTLKKNNVVAKTIIFAGDYEKATDNGVTQELYFIGDKVIYVKQAGQTDKIYYAFKDHLGSMLNLFDSNATNVFTASYDAWGKQTVSMNTFKFHRGFTGHEHLPEFGLINMNGRMYDPTLGRFISPDPFVQMPDYSQNFNRYSYVLNNPLKYTDPTGEFAWIPFAFAILSNAMMQGAMADMNGGNFWDGAWKGAVVGAATFGLGSIAPLGTTWVGSTAWGATVGTAASAGNVWASGSKNYSNIWVGTVTGGVSGFMASEEFGNMIRGQGFNSNQKVYENIMFSAYGHPEINWRQQVLDYFGFEGEYDPDLADPGQFDADTKIIKYGTSAFGGRGKSYDRLRAIYEEEKFHSVDYLTYKSKMPAGISDEHAYEEFRAQVHLYKNQGLYSNSGIDWGQRINGWGSTAGVNPDIIFKYNFNRPWWHFIFTIQRRW